MNIRLFGLQVDATGALSVIRSVKEKGAELARDGAKSAQLYADAWREQANRVARQYVPATMDAIERLRRVEQVRATQASGGLPGLLTQDDVSRSVAAYDKMIAAQKGESTAVQGQPRVP